MNNKLKIYILKHRDWLWYTPKEKILSVSEELLLENVINFGSLEDYKEYENIVGKQKIKEVFKKFKGRKKGNIYPELFHFFETYLKRVA